MSKIHSLRFNLEKSCSSRLSLWLDSSLVLYPLSLSTSSKFAKAVPSNTEFALLWVRFDIPFFFLKLKVFALFWYSF